MDSHDPIRITKNSNRRLYDAANIRHLTLDQLVEMIKEGHEVEVIDSKSKEDLTQSLLMQILLEDKGAHLFSVPFLHQLIRNRDGMLGEFFTDLVPKMLDSYLDTQDSVRKQMKAFSVPTQWMDASREMKVPDFNRFAPFQASSETTVETPPSNAESTQKEEVEELEDRLRELEERLNLMHPKSPQE